MRSLFDALFDRPQRVRSVELLDDRIGELLLQADLGRYEGYERALRTPGTVAARFARLHDELEALRLRVRRLASLAGDDGATTEARAEGERLQAALEAIERLTLAAVTFKHELLELDRAFFQRSDWIHQPDEDATFYTRSREYSYCDLNRRFVELEQAFWGRRLDEIDDPERGRAFADRVAALRADCRAFLEAAPAPGLVAEIRGCLDAAGAIVRETPYYRHHLLREWLGEAGDAVARWEHAMALPFEYARIRDAYVQLESVSLSDCTLGLAHAVAFAAEPRTVVEAWRDHVVASTVTPELLYLYAEATSGEKWTTAAFVYGLALSCQRRESEGVRWYALAGSRR